jgi:hypothetical protein
VVAVLFAHVVLHMFQDNGGSAISPPPLPEQFIDVPLEKDSATTQPAATLAPLVLPVPGGPADMLPNAAPSQRTSLRMCSPIRLRPWRRNASRRCPIRPA